MTSLIPRGAAVFSPCGVYRYRLERAIDGAYARSGRTATFIMLNPSTADADQDDPTIRRCIGFARQWRCARLIVANVFAIRSTDPRVMLAAKEPIGADTNAAITQAATDAAGPFRAGDGFPGPVVCAWGNHGSHRNRDLDILFMLAGLGIRPQCLGETATGQPRHPLYVRGSTALETFWGRE